MGNSTSSFGDFRDVSSENAEIVLVPVPFDRARSWQKGARKGPQAILDASPHLEFYDIETDTEVYKQGIHTEIPILSDASDDMIQMVKERVADILKHNQFPVVIGGDHSVSIGAVAAAVEKFAELSVLQLDAHADLRDTYMGSEFNHACVMARIREFCPIVQVGIRSMDIEEKNVMDPERVFYAHQIFGSDQWIKKAVKKLTDKVYVTIDLDVFDIGIMPSTGTPEPGGLDWYLVLKLLKEVAAKKTIIGFDVVELCPTHNKAPDFLAAKLIYKILSYIWSEKWEES
ncbi:MAG: agmatinase [SAR324 cluster bacterium]|nr:agmatinase [SAR324 cluster bacterium]